MTAKEIKIQRALGTLPLWIRIERGEVEFTTITITFPNQNQTSLIRIKCENVIATYYPNNDQSRREAIARMIKKAKILKL